MSADFKAFHKRVGIVSLFLIFFVVVVNEQLAKESFPARLLIDKVRVLQPLCPGWFGMGKPPKEQGNWR